MTAPPSRARHLRRGKSSREGSLCSAAEPRGLDAFFILQPLRKKGIEDTDAIQRLFILYLFYSRAVTSVPGSVGTFVIFSTSTFTRGQIPAYPTGGCSSMEKIVCLTARRGKTLKTRKR